MRRLSRYLAAAICVVGMGDGKVLAKGVGMEVAFSPEGSLLAVGSRTSVRLYALPTLVETGVLQASFPVLFSPDGQHLIAGTGNRVTVHDVRTGGVISDLQEHQFQVTSLAANADGSLVASGGLDGAVYLWNMGVGKQVPLFESRGNFTVESLAFSPTGRVLAALFDNNILPVWDVQTHEQIVTLKGSFAGTVAFSPDGRWLAVGRDRRLDGTLVNEVVLWDTHTWEPQVTLAGHTALVSAVTFSPDGRWLASASSDSTVRLWEIASGTEAAVFRGHVEPVVAVAFSPDGNAIASVDRLGGLLMWTLGTIQTAVEQRSWGSLKVGGSRR